MTSTWNCLLHAHSAQPCFPLKINQIKAFCFTMVIISFWKNVLYNTMRCWDTTILSTHAQIRSVWKNTIFYLCVYSSFRTLRINDTFVAVILEIRWLKSSLSANWCFQLKLFFLVRGIIIWRRAKTRLNQLLEKESGLLYIFISHFKFISQLHFSQTPWRVGHLHKL